MMPKISTKAEAARKIASLLPSKDNRAELSVRSPALGVCLFFMLLPYSSSRVCVAKRDVAQPVRLAGIGIDRRVQTGVGCGRRCVVIDSGARPAFDDDSTDTQGSRPIKIVSIFVDRDGVAIA